MQFLRMLVPLTLEPFSKLLTLPVFWGPFGPHGSHGLPIHEYVTYMTTHVALIRTATKYAISMQSMWNRFERQSVQLLFILGVLHALNPHIAVA